MLARFWSFAVTAVVLGVRMLVGAFCGVFLVGLDRWRRKKDWRVLGALLRVGIGVALGYAGWWQFVRPIDSDPELLRLLLNLGASVGALWAAIWLVFMQPVPVPPERKHEERPPER